MTQENFHIRFFFPLGIKKEFYFCSVLFKSFNCEQSLVSGFKISVFYQIKRVPGLDLYCTKHNIWGGWGGGGHGLVRLLGRGIVR